MDINVLPEVSAEIVGDLSGVQEQLRLLVSKDGIGEEY